MKKFSVVLLILALVASFAFAAAAYPEKGEDLYVEAKSWSTVAPKDSVELSGKLGAEYAFDFDKKDCAFDKSAGIAYFDLAASKTIFEGVGSVKGEGAVYAAADASVSLVLKDAAELDNKLLDPDGYYGIYLEDGTWKTTAKTVDYELTSSFKLAINNFYIAKDGAWKLNLMKSDASLDYAKSSLTSVKVYHKDSNFKKENRKDAYATYAVDVAAHTGVTFTAEADPYLAEIAFGYANKNEWNVLAKSQAVALENLTVEGGFVIGTDNTAAKNLDMGIGISAAYADDYVALKAAADFGIQDMKNDAKFDCDVYAQAKAFGATVDFYYATKPAYENITDYYFVWKGKPATSTDTDYNKAVKDSPAALIDAKYMEAKVAYEINYADIDFEVGFVAKNLNWKTRTFGATFAAKNDFASFDAEVDFTKDNGDANGPKKELKGDFDITFVADYFDAYADFEFVKRSGKGNFSWGLNVGVETDKIVDACTFGLEFNFGKGTIEDAGFDLEYGRYIKAFAKVAF